LVFVVDHAHVVTKPSRGTVIEDQNGVSDERVLVLIHAGAGFLLVVVPGQVVGVADDIGNGGNRLAHGAARGAQLGVEVGRPDARRSDQVFAPAVGGGENQGVVLDAVAGRSAARPGEGVGDGGASVGGEVHRPGLGGLGHPANGDDHRLRGWVVEVQVRGPEGAVLAGGVDDDGNCSGVLGGRIAGERRKGLWKPQIRRAAILVVGEKVESIVQNRHVIVRTLFLVLPLENEPASEWVIKERHES